MAAQESNIRKNNVGTSDYSKHKIQPWDIWEEYNLNAWDADIIKRVLRTKVDNTRRMDYEKIIHDCQKCIELIDKGSYIYDIILNKEAEYKRLHPTLTEEEYKVLEEFRNKKSDISTIVFEVGDKVFVKDLLWYNNNKNNIGSVMFSHGYSFIEEMSHYCDSEVTISEIHEDYYRIEEDNGKFKWTDEMLIK